MGRIEMAEYPTTLPAPFNDDYGVNFSSGQVVRTEMEAGNTRSRRRSSAVVDIVNCSVRLTLAQFHTFRAWFDDPGGADGGSGWFTISLLTGKTGSGKETVEAKFSGDPSAKKMETIMSVSMQLEVRYA